MSVGAQHCTGLNSDEDTSEDEEQENDDEDESGEANLWDGDWDIVALTDEEEDKERADLPESVCLTAARNKKTPLAMKYIGGDVAEDPLALLFYLTPPKLWTQIAVVESNRYHAQIIPGRARVIRSQQRRNADRVGPVEELSDIEARLSNVPDIEPWEVLRVVGLLIVRMLMPIIKGIAAHWSTKEIGALPANRFNLFMPKHRFFHSMGYLHFSNNKSPQAEIDRAWKIRPVVDVLQRTFARRYRAPPVMKLLYLHALATTQRSIQQGQASQVGDERLCGRVHKDGVLHEVRDQQQAWSCCCFLW
ncbi:hypothetical protein PC120_g3320 [Phytophthora cactorum]|nr:hypothetical protein PC120_g3320 [Phytophthora cactorum]